VKTVESFGERLALLRKHAGYSQRSFAEAIGISYRMVAYYEAQTTKPPAHLFPVISETLGISVDELLGINSTINKKSINRRLLNKLKQIEKLPRRQQQAILEHIDALVERQDK
jgi:transcriptional regulator with XRE-family HTH domain